MKYAVLLSLFAVAACGTAENRETAAEDQAAEPTHEMSEEERAAMATLDALTQKYADASAALADGYMRDPSGMCVTAEMAGLPADQGAMGVHYIHPGYTGIVPESTPVDGTEGTIDWTQPEVLVYEPQADGSEKLVAIEYLTFQAAWEAAGNTAGPDFHGTPFVHMANDPNTEADEAHGFMPHYELHIWTARENPAGMYAEWNPAVTCEHAPPPTAMN